MKILVVDDEFVALTKMKTMLSVYGVIGSAQDGNLGLKLFTLALSHRKPYDLVTIDIDMPGMNGLTFLKKICVEEERMHAVPAKKLMISAEASTENVLQANMFSADGFLVKPVKKAVLEEKLKELGIEVPQQPGFSPL